MLRCDGLTAHSAACDSDDHVELACVVGIDQWPLHEHAVDGESRRRGDGVVD